MKVCGNGYKLYLKSRPAASSESIKRMKELDCVTLSNHPLLGESSFQLSKWPANSSRVNFYKSKYTCLFAEPEDQLEMERVDLLANMKHFRPKNVSIYTTHLLSTVIYSFMDCSYCNVKQFSYL